MRFFNHLLLLFSILLATNIQGQNKYSVQIKIPDSMDGNKLSITLDDGIDTHSVTDTFTNNQLKFSGEYFSEFATLKLVFTLNETISYEHSYFIGKKPVSIIFKGNKKLNAMNPFNDYQKENAFDIFESDIIRRRNEFSKKEINDMNTFWERGNGANGLSDSLKILIVNLNRKDLEFIKNNINDYFSFWWFRSSIFPTSLTIADYDSTKLLDLLNTFQTVFPAKFTNSPEGKTIFKKIDGRLTVRKNYTAPNFEVKDIDGKILKLNSLKGKYILLDFWATWCPPCMKQIPFLKKIREEYSEESLIIMSISGDVDYKNFSNVIQNQKMNWIHVYDSEYLPQLYGITIYPTLILIDKMGTIIFDGNQEDDKLLLKLLKEL